MSFVFYPKHEYGCPQVDHCPHVGGAGLGSVVFEANENGEWIQSLWRQIDSLREESAAKTQRIEELQGQLEQTKAELKAERQKQFQTAGDDQEPPPSSPAEQPKKRGPPVGHPGWFRPTPTTIDRVVDVPARDAWAR